MFEAYWPSADPPTCGCRRQLRVGARQRRSCAKSAAGEMDCPVERLRIGGDEMGNVGHGLWVALVVSFGLGCTGGGDDGSPVGVLSQDGRASHHHDAGTDSAVATSGSDAGRDASVEAGTLSADAGSAADAAPSTASVFVAPAGSDANPCT